MSLTHQADEIWQRSTDHKQKDELRQIISVIRDTTNDLIDSAGEVAGQHGAGGPALNALDNSRTTLLNALKNLTAVSTRKKGSEADRAPVLPPQPVPEEDNSTLVRLAKEEVTTALTIADEAQTIANKIKDPQKKKQALDHIGQLRVAADNVLKAAKTAANAPDDLAAQQALTLAQHELANTLKNISYIYGADEEFTLATNAVETALHDDSAYGKNVGLGSSIFASAQVVLDLIARDFVGDGSDVAIRHVMESARGVCGKTTELIGEIKKLNRETKQKELKDVLGTISKILNDRAIRIKIISIVKLAGGEGGGEVSMAVRGLEYEIGDAVRVIRAHILQIRLAAAINQSLALKRVLGLWKAKAAV